MKKLPSYIIIGDIRCGTTSFYNMLIQHPKIVPASCKELYFFNHFGKDDRWNQGIKWYLNHLGDCQEGQITGEATPEYLWAYKKVPQRINQVCPNVKFIVLLRNPVNRIYSHFHLYKRSMEVTHRIPVTNSFYKMMEDTFDNKNNAIANIGRLHLKRGEYAHQLKEWFKIFPREQFLIIKSEDMFKAPNKEVNKAFKFLGIEEHNIEPIHIAKGKRPEMKKEWKDKLKKYFTQPNHELYELLGKNLNWEKEI